MSVLHFPNFLPAHRLPAALQHYSTAAHWADCGLHVPACSCITCSDLCLLVLQSCTYLLLYVSYSIIFKTHFCHPFEFQIVKVVILCCLFLLLQSLDTQTRQAVKSHLILPLYQHSILLCRLQKKLMLYPYFRKLFLLPIYYLFCLTLHKKNDLERKMNYVSNNQSITCFQCSLSSQPCNISTQDSNNSSGSQI